MIHTFEPFYFKRMDSQSEGSCNTNKNGSGDLQIISGQYIFEDIKWYFKVIL